MKYILTLIVLGTLFLPTFSYGGILPANPEFVEWASRKGQVRELVEPPVDAAPGHLLKHRPSPVNRAYMADKIIAPAGSSRGLESFVTPTESHYDLRDYGYAPGSRDQNPYGTCWAFGAMASMESSALRKGWSNPNFSEKHLAYYAYSNVSSSLVSFDRETLPYPNSIYDQGGNSDMAIAMLSRGTGAVAETTVRYANMGPCAGNTSLPSGTTPPASPANAAWLTDTHYAPGGSGVVDNIKYLVKTYGATYVSIYWAESSFRESTNAFYNNSTTSTNHAVAIVGWDDTYSRTNFTSSPANDGAWIVRNSWGSGWGDGGYFYISYEDRTIVDKGAWAYEAVPVEENLHQYLYDPLSWCATYSNDSDRVWMANIFQASAAENLKYVTLRTAGVGDTVTVSIYTGVTSGHPRSGTLAYQSPGTFFESPGHHTIELPDSVSLESGQRFSVVVTIQSSDNTAYITVEEPIDGWSSKAKAAAGQSFVSADGSSWTDATSIAANANVCIRALAKPVQTYVITASTGNGGVISPVGDVVVPKNSAQSFSISAESGYEVTDVLVDNTSVGVVSSYVFSDVTADHSIRVIAAQSDVGYSQIVSFYHTLALKADGSLWAWGTNAYGELGDGTKTRRAYPIPTGHTFASVYAGYGYSMGLKSDGSLWAWGYNSKGKLGDGTTTNRSTPVKIGEDFETVSLGYHHSLGLKADGTLWGWGTNGRYQVDSTQENYLRPKQIGEDLYIAVAAGVFCSYAVKADGTLWAWGDNYKGQLGDGTTTSRRYPVQVDGSGYTAISAGYDFALALKSDGTLWAWGANDKYQLGDGTTTDRNTPQLIGSGFSSAKAGTAFSYGLKTDGTLWTWGDNSFGQLGNGTTEFHMKPIQVGSDYNSISVGRLRGFAQRTDGSYWACGNNSFGGLGDGTTTDQYSFVLLSDPTPANHVISASSQSNGTILPNGNVTVSDHGNQVFSISVEPGYRVKDVLVDGISVGAVSSYSFQDVTSSHTIHVETAFIVENGISASAQVGGLVSPGGELIVFEHEDQTFTIGAIKGYKVIDVVVDGRSVGVVSSYTFSDVVADHSIHVKTAKEGNGYAQISAYLSTLELKPSGTLWVWGWNSYGEFGDGTTTERWRPYLIGETYVTIHAGRFCSFGIKKNGSLWAWGLNEYGVLGDGTTTKRLNPVKVGDGFAAVAAGVYHVIGLKADGTLWTWGHNNYGQLGDGSTTDQLRPKQIGEGYTAIAAGQYSSYALKFDGTIWAWGSNLKGCLGDGTVDQRNSPVKVYGTGYCAISASLNSAYAMKPDGTVWAWGDNDHWELGDGTKISRSLPKQIGHDFVDISAGYQSSYGLKNDGTLWTWGFDLRGQLANGGTADYHYVPTQVESGVESIYAEHLSGFIVKTDGSLWACGFNAYGQLGDGTTIDRNAFVKIHSAEPQIAPIMQILLQE